MIRVQYAADRATIQLHGEIDVSTALELAAEIALCFEYYRLPLVDLQLDSPGGGSDARSICWIDSPPGVPGG